MKGVEILESPYSGNISKDVEGAQAVQECFVLRLKIISS